MPDVAAPENRSPVARPEPGLRHRLPHRSAGSADRIPAGTTANAGPIESTTLGRDRHRGGGHPPTPAPPDRTGGRPRKTPRQTHGKRRPNKTTPRGRGRGGGGRPPPAPCHT